MRVEKGISPSGFFGIKVILLTVVVCRKAKVFHRLESLEMLTSCSAMDYGLVDFAKPTTSNVFLMHKWYLWAA